MVVPGNRSVISPGNFTATPRRRSPLDMKFPSRGNFNNGGIGLGIVAALEKSTIRINQHEISSPVCSGSNRTDPVHSNRRFRFSPVVEIDDLSEEYTCVTNRDGMNKVYYNEDEFEFRKNLSVGDRPSDKPIEESPAKKKEVFRDSLSSCCLCEKKLKGKDIYMYKGDKGFCSEECRSVRIMEDNLKVQRKSTSVEVLSSPYTGGQISSAGIFVIC
ncbi:unnamed protein product [Arabis nemorensis]|uniref:FLZ-type domain-containing protein n=1 Tax=Arabis nemorensis TaxID=586526 RepID=A0A565ASH0_9BRAS|nr:unnamed protein product [Arabis nemorensis]